MAQLIPFLVSIVAASHFFLGKIYGQEQKVLQGPDK